MSETTLELIVDQSIGDKVILATIGELREVFQNHFDRTWFSLIIDGMPIDPRTMREIRELVSQTAIFPGSEWQMHERVRDLETFCATVRRFLLPVLRERLGISWLFPSRRVRDRSQAILRKLVAFSFPHNLETLQHLTEKLKGLLRLYYPLA